MRLERAVLAEPALLLDTGELNQAFARVSVAATDASIVLWGAALWQRNGAARLPAAAGVIVGAALARGSCLDPSP
jgi:hypothetical protein